MTDEPPETAPPAPPAPRRRRPATSTTPAGGVKAVPPVAPPAPGARIAIGIDVGGSGIKGAPVDLDKGRLADDRLRIPTPQPSTPEAVAEVVGQILDHFGWKEPFGCTFPAVVQHGVTQTAANVDKSWIGADAHHVIKAVTGRKALVVNDADAAGVAEVEFGAAKGHKGTVLVSTLGTGIGSALVIGGRLVPNTEFGHLEIDGADAETRAADSARERRSCPGRTGAPG